MHLAASYGHTATITALLDNRADITARAKYGNTPLHLAAWNSNADAITLLLDAGAEPKAKDKDNRTAFDLIDEDNPIYGTDAYWQLKDAKYNR